MVTMLEHFGGSLQSFAIDGSVYNSIGNAYEMQSQYAWNKYRIWRWSPSNATAYVELPDPDGDSIPEGGPIYYFENLDAATYGIRVYTKGHVFVGEVGPQNALGYNQCVVFLLDAALDVWAMYGVRHDQTPAISNATLGP